MGATESPSQALSRPGRCYFIPIGYNGKKMASRRGGLLILNHCAFEGGNMSGHDHGHHEEDHSVCVKVGIFFIFTVITLYLLAV